jgi:precorrin-3B synthase
MTGGDLRRGWCPSLLRPMESGDGWLVRVRPRAAVITAAVARAVAKAAMRYGNGRIEITNRANLQIRGLRPETTAPFAAAMEAVEAADDGPAILVSPLAGADPGLAAETLEIMEAIAAHDEENGAIGELPAKFGFLVDGGGALPLTGLSLDITLRAAGGRWRLNGADVPAGEAASRAIALARMLARVPRRVAARAAAPPALGFQPYGDGSVGAVLLAPAFGQLQAVQLAALADLAQRQGDGRLRPTPWKSLVIAGVARSEVKALQAEAEAIGVIANPGDPRMGIVTCVGAPACSRGEVNTQAAASLLAASRHEGDPLLHLSGCAKGCAHPGAAAVTIEGEGGRFAFIRDGRPGDEAVARGLTLAQCAALMQRVPA